MKLKVFAILLMLRLTDALRSQAFAKTISLALYCSYLVTPLFRVRLKLLMLAHRTYPHALVSRAVLTRTKDIAVNALELTAYDSSTATEKDLERAIILKLPRIDADGTCIERGVYLIKFTHTFQRYLQLVDIYLLQEYFHIVLEPSWSGYCLPELLAWTNYNSPVIVESSEPRDFQFLQSVSPKLIPVSFGSGDWVNHEVFYPIEGCEKVYDSIYVSNYTSIKRNHAYLRALSRVTIPSFKAAIVCGGWGGGKKLLNTLIKHYGLQDSITVYERLPQPEINKLLNQSKVNVLLSLKEGSNRSLFEGMFANVPAIALKDNIGVNKDYFTDQTGRLVDEEELPRTLEYFYSSYESFSPREWCMANISIYRTKEKLDSQLKSLAHQDNEPWTSGTLLKTNAPEAIYFDQKDYFRAPPVRDVVPLFLKRRNKSIIGRELKRILSGAHSKNIEKSEPTSN